MENAEILSSQSTRYVEPHFTASGYEKLMIYIINYGYYFCINPFKFHLDIEQNRYVLVQCGTRKVKFILI